MRPAEDSFRYQIPIQRKSDSLRAVVELRLGIEQRLSGLKITLIGFDVRPGAIADVIFVHGLAGDGETTWQIAGDTSTYWPLWLFDQITTVNVWSLTYPAAAVRWGKAGEGVLLPDRAKAVLDILCSNGIGRRPIVFVAHSLGGLLAKQIIRSASELNIQEWTELADNVRGIIFLGTPHNGSGIASFAKALSIFGASAVLAFAISSGHHDHRTKTNPYLASNV
jgi:pimeloyl-ACP methyl ester carboxylesterase